MTTFKHRNLIKERELAEMEGGGWKRRTKGYEEDRPYTIYTYTNTTWPPDERKEDMLCGTV